MPFTQGPWRFTNAGYDDNLCYKVQIGTSERTVAYAYSASGDKEDEQVANAHLLAAAPELYEALQNFLDWNKSTDPKLREQLAQAARITLAKARGEEK